MGSVTEFMNPPRQQTSSSTPTPTPSSTTAIPTPIAITGLSYRLPSSISTDEAFWRFCTKAQSAWSPIPPTRFNASAYYHQNPDHLGTFTPRGGYFLSQDVSLFDASFFSITAEEARSMDPQQRLILETAYEALESAGATRISLTNETVGVFAAGTNVDYDRQTGRDSEQIPRYNVGGTAGAFLANRVSHFFDLNGPSFTVDTACSSSLTALHVAVQSLRSGESSAALVGGCHLNLDPGWFASFSASSLLNSSGKCHSFDHNATSGYGRGEGAGCVFLRPLDAAIAAGDNVLAVIMNTGINQDGHTPGISMPSNAAQERLIRSVYQSAKIDPRETAYVEAHGTGTKVGDPVEAEALYRCFCKEGSGRSRRNPLLIGSAKSNFGHAEGASGMVSLVKTVLMLQRGFILPNAGFEKAREDIPWDEWDLKVPRKLMPWPAAKPYASINNFGLGGANTHVILRKAPVQLSMGGGEGLVQTNKNLRLVYILSANSEEAVLTQAKNLEVYLERNPAAYDPRLIYDLAYTLGERRNLLPWKIAVSAQSAQELLTALSAKETRPRRAMQQPKAMFVFTGQGAHWHAMGTELIQGYPVFQDIIKQVDQCLLRLGAGFSLVEELSRDENSSRLSLPHISQSACTAVQLGLTALLHSWGVRPEAVIGHSSGEIAAAYAAGIISLEDSMCIAYQRGMAARSLQENFPAVKGAMMAVGAGLNTIQTLLQELTHGHASVACVNSAQNVTVSGDETAINELQSVATARGFFHRRLNVNVAYHSTHINLVANEYLSRIDTIRPSNSAVPFYSSARSELLDACELGPAYWVENLVSCVQFAPAIQKALDTEKANRSTIDLLIEIGPHPALASAVGDILQSSTHHTTSEYLPTLRRFKDAVQCMHELAIALILHGHTLDFKALNPLHSHGFAPSVLCDLPRYPWDHSKRYWHTSRLAQNHLFKPFARHDLLGSLSTESDDLEPRWRTIIRLEDHPWLKDHRVQGRATFPMTAFLAMAIEAARQSALLWKIDFDTFHLREACIGKMLIIPDSTPVELTTSLRPVSEGTRSSPSSSSSTSWYEIRVLSWVDHRGWDENFRSLICTPTQLKPNPVTGDALSRHQLQSQTTDLLTLQKSCKTPVHSSSLYQDLQNKGFQYDRLFSNPSEYRTNDNKSTATATIHTPDSIRDDLVDSGLPEGRMKLHPAILDLFVHALWPTFGAGTETGLASLYVPSYIKEVLVAKEFEIRPRDEFRAIARRTTPLKIDRPVNGDIWVTAGDSSPVLFRWEGLAMTPIQHAADIDAKLGQGKGFYQVQMEQCFDFMARDEIRALCDERGNVIQSKMDEAAYIYARKAISSAPEKVLRDLTQFYTGLEKRVKETPLSTLCYNIPDDIATFCNDRQAGQMIREAGTRLPELLSGAVQVDGTFGSGIGGLDKFYTDSTLCNPVYQQAATCLSLMAAQQPNLRVLEIGTTLTGTAQILASLSPGSRFREYVFGDLSGSNTQGSILGKWAERVHIRPLAVSGHPEDQGWQRGSFEIMVVEAMPGNMQEIIAFACDLLVKGGKLILVEAGEMYLREFPVALLTGKWQERTSRSRSEWITILYDSGLFEIKSFSTNDDGKVIVSSSRAPQFQSQVVIVHNNDLTHHWLSGLAATIQGFKTTIPIVRSLDEVTASELSGSICVFTGDIRQPILPDITLSQFQRLKCLIQTCSGILWVTQNASQNPGSNLVSGLARTIRSELDIPFATLDLDAPTESSLGPWSHAHHHTITTILQTIFSESTSVLCDGDYEFTVRNGSLFVPRIKPDPHFTDAVYRTTSPSASSPQPIHQKNRPLHLQIQDYGMLDSLYFTDIDIPTTPTTDGILPPDSVQISPHSIGLNFRDIMHANNQIPVSGFGIECSGTITATGSNVSHLRIGDRVCAVAETCFSTLTTCPAACVWPIPDHMSFEVAASIPVVFTTAIYSLLTIGRLIKGETVLIHAAAGGVGQAAIMVAQASGAGAIFATVSNAQKKQHLVEKYGLVPEHIFYSRDLSFAQGVMCATNGVGVDIVLNSLAGEYLRASIECVAPFGRFIEIGKRDIAINGRLEMGVFARNVSFAAVDLSVFGVQRPGILRGLLEETFKLLGTGRVSPVMPVRVFDVSEVGSALQALQSGQGMGKVVVNLGEDSLVNVMPACPRESKCLHGDGMYIVIGGTGGLGRSITSWLARQGARHVLLVSRRGMDSPGIRELISSMAPQDVTVSALGCNIANPTDIQSILMPYLQQSPSVRGVIHSAMVLKDAAFENTTWSDYTAVLRPKVSGIYNLHDLDLPQLDFFIALSSISGIVGNKGQSAYAAANTFLDSFSHYRQAQGKPFISIDLAAMRDVGYLAQPETQGSISQVLSETSLDEKDFHNILTGAIHRRANTSPNAHILTGLRSIPIQDTQEQPFWSSDARFAYLLDYNTQTQTTSTEISASPLQTAGDRLKRAQNPTEAEDIVVTALAHKIAAVVICPVEDIEATSSVSKLNLDSLSAIEIRKWISRELEASLQLLEILTSASLRELAGVVVGKSRLVNF